MGVHEESRNETTETKIRRFCTFRLSGRLYGVDIQDVKEINTETSTTPIHHAPEEIKGYINIRGQVYLLLDIRKIFGFQEKTIDKNSRVILFIPELGDPYGILVDSIDDVVNVDENQIENRRKNQDEHEGTDRRGFDVGEGVCMLKDELLIVLNAKKLFRSIKLF